MSMTPTTVLWFYIGLLLAGGLLGFFKTRSQVTLFMSLGFGGILSLCALHKLPSRPHADVLLFLLLMVFTWRFADKRRFLPGGLMMVATVLTLALRNVL